MAHPPQKKNISSHWQVGFLLHMLFKAPEEAPCLVMYCDFCASVAQYFLSHLCCVPCAPQLLGSNGSGLFSPLLCLPIARRTCLVVLGCGKKCNKIDLRAMAAVNPWDGVLGWVISLHAALSLGRCEEGNSSLTVEWPSWRVHLFTCFDSTEIA